MAYGLPARGQQDWDDELNNSIESLRGSTQASEARSTVAQAHSIYARNRVDDLASILANGVSLPLREDPDEPGTYLVLSNAFISEDPDDAGTYLIGA